MESIIRPIKRRTFLSQGKVMREHKQPGSDEVEAIPEGEYGLTKMPGSFQGKRIFWSEGERRWLIEITPEDLDKMVKNSALKYKEGRKKGEMIEKANIKDPEDPFFIHPEFNLFLDEGSAETSTNNSVEKLIIDSFKARGEVVTPTDGQTKYRGVVVEYEIVDKDFDKKIKNAETQRRFDTVDLLRNSDFSKKKKVATIMKIIFDKNLKEDDLNTLMLSILDVSSDKSDTFRRLSKLDKDELELKYLVHKGMSPSVGVIKRSPSKNQYILNGTTSIGRTIEQSEAFFADEENFGFLEELQELIIE